MGYYFRKFGCELEIPRGLVGPVIDHDDVRNAIK
jgi:hypothetical protein